MTTSRTPARVLIRERGTVQFDQMVGQLGNRVERASATLPQTPDDEALFSISGGRIMLTAIIGEVTVVIETQACDTKLKFNPTATGADQDLCGVLDITADAVGEMYTITGIVANAMRSDLLIGQAMTNHLILSEGDIEIDCAANNTGEVAWTLFYYPIDDDAIVEAA